MQIVIYHKLIALKAFISISFNFELHLSDHAKTFHTNISPAAFFIAGVFREPVSDRFFKPSSVNPAS